MPNDWLADGGELGELVRHTDWSRTSLGPRELWPPSLRTVVGVVMTSRFPMVVFWGSELLAVYNDAYRGIVAGDRALGRPACELGDADAIAVAASGESRLVEDKVVSDDAHFCASYTPVRAEDGSIGGVLASFQEIAVARDVERFRTLVENSRDGLNLLDLKSGLYMFMNPAQIAMTGFTAEEMNAFPSEEALARVHPDDRHVSMEQQRQVVAGLDPGGSPVEYRWKVKSGEYRWFSDSRKLVRDAQGRPAVLVGVSRDITERRLAEAIDREHRHLFLLGLSDALGQLRDPDEIRFTAARMLGEHLHANRALYAEIVDENVALIGRHYTSGVVEVTGSFPLELYGEDSLAAFRRGESITIDDITTTSRIPLAAREAFLAAGTAAVIGTSLWKEGRWVGAFGVHGRAPRTWQPWEVTLVEETAERTWSALQRANAELALRETQERLRVALQHTDISVFNMDRDLRYTWVFNPHPAFQPEGVVGRTDPDLFSAEEAAHLTALKRRILATGEPLKVEIALGFGGEVHWYDLKAEPLRDPTGAIIGLTCAAIEVTERKREAELLRRTTDQLRDADQRKTEFLAMLSHELRNPLGAIRNGIIILERVPPGSDQARRAQGIIARQVDHMAHLIDDLLEATRITRGKIELQRERVDLDDLLHRVIEDHAPEFARVGVGLGLERAHRAVWIDGDRIRLAQILGNVLQNAAKFTPRGGHATVSLVVDAGHATVRVRDTGRGIQPELLSRVFEPFAQADTSLDRRLGGLGLGLAVARGLVELHGGTIRAESRGADLGTTFEIVLPLDTSHRDATATRAASDGVPRRHVLVIEDNRDAAEAICAVLELEGHHVDLAFDGPQGLAQARASPPDIVLCDIGLPEMNGLEVARTMRTNPALSRLVLVALTGYAQPEDVARAKQVGFDAHLAKPIELDRLRKVIAMAPVRS